MGVPVFLLHGWLAQRAALRDEDERSSRTRAVFLYGALLATLLPVAQNFLALVNRGVLQAMGQDFWGSIVGAEQSVSDNLIAMLANAAVAGGIFALLRADWQAVPKGDAFTEVRRLYRHIWLVYGLALGLPGLLQVVRYLLLFWQAGDWVTRLLFANGLALAVTGIPIWAFAWLVIVRSLATPAERQSVLRQIVLFVLLVVGAIGAFVATTQFFSALFYFILMAVLGNGLLGQELLRAVSEAIAVALPFGGLWLVYERALASDLRTGAEVLGEAELEKLAQKQAGLRRVHLYLLALIGLTGLLSGTTAFFSMLIEWLMDRVYYDMSAFLGELMTALSIALVGLAVWLAVWLPVQRQARQDGLGEYSRQGHHARRSLVRRGYLYLALFVGLIGVMVGAGMLLFNLFSAALGSDALDLLYQVLQQAHVLALFLALLIYHWLTLRTDGRMAQRSLGGQQARFPVLILAPDDPAFAEQVVHALQQQVPALPVAVHLYSQGVPDGALSEARLVILPAELLAHPSEAIRLWLQAFDGLRLVLPTPMPGWQWVGGKTRSFSQLANQAAQAVRQIAEGPDRPQE